MYNDVKLNRLIEAKATFLLYLLYAIPAVDAKALTL
jgi:hypothetical protein